MPSLSGCTEMCVKRAEHTRHNSTRRAWVVTAVADDSDRYGFSRGAIS